MLGSLPGLLNSARLRAILSCRHGFGGAGPGRWTVILLRELMAGSERFNDLRRGMPLISPALLSKRLSELEELGVIRRSVDPATGSPLYRLTGSGQDLGPVIMTSAVNSA